jgi:hypothetical protein
MKRCRVRLILAVVLVFATTVGGSTAVVAQVPQPCVILPVRCVFEGLAFEITVVDSESGQPLPDVHAVAEWRRFSAGMRANGPLMAQDAVSDTAGVLRFPAWGPVEGSGSGLVFGDDPVITLFKPGFEWLRISNEGSHDTNERDRIRRFFPAGRVYVLKAFRGTDAEWLEQLKKAGNPAASPLSDEMLLQFRTTYVNRLRRVHAELLRLPSDLHAAARRQMALFPNLQFLETGHR